MSEGEESGGRENERRKREKNEQNILTGKVTTLEMQNNKSIVSLVNTQ